MNPNNGFKLTSVGLWGVLLLMLSALPGWGQDSLERITPVDLESELNEQQGDPELGVLRLQLLDEQPISQPSFPKVSVFLQGRTGFSSNSNILSSIDPVDDQIFWFGGDLSIVPQFSPKTLLISRLGGSWVRYNQFEELDFSKFQTQLKLRQILSQRSFAEVGWTHEQFFDADGGDQFLRNETIELGFVYNYPIRDRLGLRNFVQSEYTFSSPQDRSKVLNRVGTNLRYDITDTLDVGLTYSLDIGLFTHQDRLDLYHQTLSSLSWEFAKYNRLNVYTGLTFGSSSNTNLNFEGFLLGVGIQSNLKLF